MWDRKTTQEILLRCLRFDKDAGSAEIEPLVRTLTPDDSGSLFHEAVRHEIAPFLYRRLLTILQDLGLPVDPLKRFRAVYLQTAARNMRLLEELGIVLEALKKSNVAAIPLKGAYLAEAVYRDMALRVFSDIDLLIRKSDLEKAHEIFQEQAFHPLEYDRKVADDLHEWRYVHKASGWALEIHWGIVSKSYPFSIDVDRLWENSRRRKISGVDVSVLSPEDMLLHLCLNASIHNYSRGLKVLCDIGQFVASAEAEIDWARVRRQALEWKTTRCAYLTLKLARDMVNAGIPEDFLDGLKPGENAEIPYEAARDVILMNENSLGSGIPVLPTMSVFLGKKERKDKLKLLFKKALPTRRFIAGQFPVSARSIWVYFFYPLWIIILIRRNYPSIRELFLRKLISSNSLVEEKKKWGLSDWLLSP